MSKILSVTIAIVVVTVTIVPRIIGTITLRNSWRSEAPSSRAASMISRRHALDRRREDDHGEARLEPDQDHDLDGRLIGNWWHHGIGWPPNAVQTAFRSPNCGWLGGCQA